DIVENSSDLICTHDLDGNILWVNNAAIKITGYSKEELLKMNLQSLLVPEYRNLFNTYLAKIKTNGHDNGLMKIQTKTGERRIWKYSNTLRTQGVAKSIVRGMVEDITERKQAEELLREHEERFRSLYENSTIGLYRTTSDGKIILANPAIIKMLGYSSFEELAERNLEEEGFEPNYERKQFLEQVEMNGEIIGLESAWTRKDGMVVYIRESAKAIRNSSGKTLYYDGTVEDISERKIAEEALRQSEESYKLLFENNPHPMWAYDLTTLKFLAVNNAAVAKYGYSKEEFLSMKLADIRPKEDESKLFNNIAENNERIQKSGEWRHKLKDGSIIIVEILSHSLKFVGKQARLVIANDITKSKQAEEEIRNSEIKYRNIFENIQDVYYETSIDGTILEVSPSIKRLTKGMYKSEDLIGKSMYDFYFDPNERDLFIEHLINHKGLFDYEITFRNRDNTTVFCSTSATIKLNSEGKPVKIIGSIRDITERKLAEDKLIASEIRYRRLFESAKDGILIIDVETGKIVDVNPFLIKLLGYSKEQFLEKEIWEIGFFRDIVANKEKFLELQENEYARYEDLPLETADRRKIYVEFVSNVYLVDKLKVIQCNIRDITERKHAEDEVRKLYRGVHQSPASVIITNLKGEIEYVNSKTLEVTGYKSSEVLGKNPRMFQSGEKTKEEYAELWNTILSGKEWNGELHDKKKNGELYWENASISPIKNEKGEITNFIAIKEDITERKKMVQELTLALEKAEEMNRLKSSFFANMSHELRTPLIGINGFSEFLVESLKDPELKKISGYVLKSGQRLSETLNLILDITKFESDRMDFKLETVELVSETEELINSFKEAAQKKGTKLTASFSGKTINLNTDIRAYRTVINNLINNAVKFTHEGEITVSVSSKDNYIEIKVMDTGIGIAKKDQEIIFEEFRQASEGFKRNFEGTGLGLSITKKLVEKFGGNIIVESELGKGSTFIVKLPITEEAKIIEKISKEIIIDNKLTKLVSVKPKALLVDDDPFVIKILKGYIGDLVELEWASNAEIGIKLLKNERYDIVFMDINLRHGLDGVQATKEIRKMREYESIPIIAVTAYAFDGEKKEFLAAGCSHYLSKPFTKQGVLSLMEEILRSINKA
ncbi:MAG: PAS domain S-box protein, partial [Ignavibacteriaceae bacterium]